MRDDESFVPVEEKLRLQARAYKQLLAGSERLLEHGSIFWTERLLLQLVRNLYSRRIMQVAGFISIKGVGEDAPARENEALLDALAEASLGGHDLGQWEKVDNGYQASCQLCHSTTWIGENGMRYSLLEDTCPNRRDAP